MSVKTRIVVIGHALAAKVAKALVDKGHEDVEVITMEEGAYNVPITREARFMVDGLEYKNTIDDKIAKLEDYEHRTKHLHKACSPEQERQRQKQDAQQQRTRMRAKALNVRR